MSSALIASMYSWPQSSYKKRFSIISHLLKHLKWHQCSDRWHPQDHIKTSNSPRTMQYLQSCSSPHGPFSFFVDVGTFPSSWGMCWSLDSPGSLPKSSSKIGIPSSFCPLILTFASIKATYIISHPGGALCFTSSATYSKDYGPLYHVLSPHGLHSLIYYVALPPGDAAWSQVDQGERYDSHKLNYKINHSTTFKGTKECNSLITAQLWRPGRYHLLARQPNGTHITTILPL